MNSISGLSQKFLSNLERIFFLIKTKFRAGFIRLHKKIETYRSESTISEITVPIGSSQKSDRSEWMENSPPFSYWETQEETVFPNAKRIVRTRTVRRGNPWFLSGILFGKTKPSELDPISRAFSPSEKESEIARPQNRKRKPLFRSRPYFWEIWFPQISTLTLSPLVVWECEIPHSAFRDCLPESVLPFGPPGKWKVRIYSMKVLSHQLGNLYEDFFSSPNVVRRSEIWVYGHRSQESIDPENLRLFPLGVWIHPSILKEEDPRLRIGLPFRSGETDWSIQGDILTIRIRDLSWSWKPASLGSETRADLSAPHFFFGKESIRLLPEFPQSGLMEAYLYKRAIVSDPKAFQRSNPSRNLS
ncbi:hypothetical protein EHO60_00255 [Leptospira fletcheri]|uniref:Uncharacterized protein n=1 Tax=Leptospira fletcheri TaxID=2484981 RepID=A0A4R9GL16_9LEPT|nr:hypothetical protein [Leptospira fletcheri]TGK13826.1 hypothetical protein EHO60_00255 [Leptospira fletcheri]